MRTKNNGAARGFTLVEMLVVITIITILAGLVVPAVWSAMAKTVDAQIAMEVNGLAMAMEDFKGEFGSYPPDFSNTAEVENFLRRMFPRRDPSADALPSGLGPESALSFWLGGFSSDPTKPVTGAGDRNPRFPFDKTRTANHINITDRSNKVVQSYFAYHPRELTQPFVYLHWKTYATAAYVSPTGNGTAKPYNDSSDVLNATAVNPRKFQIISAGQDDEYGVGGASYPSGPYGVQDRDNITNFSDGKTLQDRTPGL